MRNTQNLSIICPEPPPAIGDETTWSLSGATVGFISQLLALGVPFLLYGSNTFLLLLHTWSFSLVLMPVVVVVGIALYSLLNGKLFYSASAIIPTVGLTLVLLSLWLLGWPVSGMNQTWVLAAKIWYSPRATWRHPRASVAYPGELWDDDAVFQGTGWVN